MPRTIEPFESRHLPEAAGLLAVRHRKDRQRDGRLPAAYESEAATLPLLETLLARGNGVVTKEAGSIVGYLLGTYDLDWGGRSRLIPMEGHAVEHVDAVEVYREMYAAASPAWIEEGYFQHTINVPAEDTIAGQAFNSLGFGQMLAFGLRDTSPLPDGKTGIRVERATEASIGEVQELMSGLGRYNSTSPLYRPFVPSPGPDWPRLPLVQKQMADEACSYWLGYDGDRPAGVMIFTPPDPTEKMVNPQDSIYLWIAYVRPDTRTGGIGKALVDHGLAWARERGHTHCTVGWFTSNVVGGRFWRGRGYQPVMYRLERRLDERIGWARAKGW